MERKGKGGKGEWNGLTSHWQLPEGPHPSSSSREFPRKTAQHDSQAGQADGRDDSEDSEEKGETEGKGKTEIGRCGRRLRESKNEASLPLSRIILDSKPFFPNPQIQR